jgi:hypothetical protein
MIFAQLPSSLLVAIVLGTACNSWSRKDEYDRLLELPAPLRYDTIPKLSASSQIELYIHWADSGDDVDLDVYGAILQSDSVLARPLAERLLVEQVPKNVASLISLGTAVLTRLQERKVVVDTAKLARAIMVANHCSKPVTFCTDLRPSQAKRS